MVRGAWQATVHVTESDTTERLSLSLSVCIKAVWLILDGFTKVQ